MRREVCAEPEGLAVGIAQLQKRSSGQMTDFGADLRREVIRPTLEYLGVPLAGAEELLVALALLAERFDTDGSGLGPFHLTATQHRQVWDDYLAFHPDLASEVRGLASQRCFLQFPDRELTTNLAYATAIAWILISTSGYELPAPGDTEGQVALWQHLFQADRGVAATAGEARSWLRRHARAT